MTSESSGARALSEAHEVAQPVLYALQLEDGTLRFSLFVHEAAPLLGLSEERVRVMIRKGQLRVRNPNPNSRNSRYLIPISSLIEYLNGQDEPIPPAA